MNKFGLSGILEHPASTIPAVLVGVGGIVTALGWCDAATWERYSVGLGSVLVTLIGALYKGKEVPPPEVPK